MGTLGWIILLSLVFLLLLGLLGWATALVIQEWERGVVLTLGRFSGVRHAGLRFVVPVLQTIEPVDMRVKVIDVQPLEVITQDNVFVRVNAIIYYKVFDPRMAIIDVSDFAAVTKEMAQATLRNVIGGSQLDEIASPEGKVPSVIKEVLSTKTKEWGVRVTDVEIKEINVDPAMVRSISREAEAERNRRAVVIESKGELQAAENFAAAAKIINASPGAMQLRHLATLTDIAGDKTNTIVFPLPDFSAMFGGEKPASTASAAETKMLNDMASDVIKALTDKSSKETER